MIRVRSIRVRMMLLFCAVVGVLLVLSYTGFYLMFEQVMRDQLDVRLRTTAAPIIADLIVDMVAEPEEKDVNGLDIADEFFEVLDSSGHAVQRSRNLTADLPVALDRRP